MKQSWILISLLSFISIPAFASTECFSADSKGHMWSSTGLSESSATLVAVNFCKAYSPNGGCHPKNCVEK